MIRIVNSLHVQTALPILLNLYYYCLKPALPARVRRTLRVISGKFVRLACATTWPINHETSRKPPGWPGWPHGKSFAFVISHDVERREGLERCSALADLEMRLGFRSSFNFVPEGEYITPATLRESLAHCGFEIGVHDLRHDGTLYRSKQGFARDADRINHYVREWSASGFRSGFMRHNLDWIKQLDVLYDSSTFDTDPFEPQPDGANTIFPFGVARDDGSSYVELPYTLAQDSTLFLVLREKRNDVWKVKLDWIAAHGGMALLNVHPDYMTFSGPGSASTYPVALYEDFLEYVAAQYGDRAWFARPIDVARYAQSHFQPTASFVSASEPAMPHERVS